MYRLPTPFKDEPINCVLTEDRKKAIPFDPDNTDYQEYLKWVAEGNVALPADEAK